MVKLTVYGNKTTSCTQRVMILLEELDLEYEFIKIDLEKGENKESVFLEKNPFGKVPVVKYDARILFESRTILKYISKANRDIQDFYGDIIVDMWLEVEGQKFNIFAEEILKNKDNQEKNKQFMEEFGKILDIYDKVLSEREYISSDKYTIADMAHIPLAYQLMKNGYKEIFKQRLNVYNWLKRIMKRDPVKRVIFECY